MIIKQQQLRKLIQCEVDCIKSGNKLTPSEQEIAIEVCKNIENRIEGLNQYDSNRSETPQI